MPVELTPATQKVPEPVATLAAELPPDQGWARGARQRGAPPRPAAPRGNAFPIGSGDERVYAHVGRSHARDGWRLR